MYLVHHALLGDVVIQELNTVTVQKVLEEC